MTIKNLPQSVFKLLRAKLDVLSLFLILFLILLQGNHFLRASDFSEAVDENTLTQMIRMAEESVQSQIKGERFEATRVLVLGVTGSGKSTLVHSLVGVQPNVKKGAGKMELHIDPSEVLFGFQIGHGVSSATTTPGSYYDKRTNLVYCDCPGFMDSRGPSQDIVNAFSINQLFSPPSRIKTLLVIQESEITDGRAGAAFARFDKLMKLLPNFDELKRSVGLVLTKFRGDFSPQELLQGAAEGSSNPLLQFFVSQPDRVFTFPYPSGISSGQAYNLFVERDRVTQFLQKNPVVNPMHAIDLDPGAVVHVAKIMKNFGDIEDLIFDFSNNIQFEYKGKDISTLEYWEKAISTLSLLIDEHVDTPEKLALAVQKAFPSPSEEIKKILEEMKSTRRLYTFAEKIGMGNILESLPDIQKILQPLLRNIHADLQELIEHKKMVEEQQQKTDKLTEDLQKQQEEAELRAIEQQKQLDALSAQSKEENEKLAFQLEEQIREGKIAREDAQRQIREHQERSNIEIARANQRLEEVYLNLQKVQENAINQEKTHQKEIKEQRERSDARLVQVEQRLNEETRRIKEESNSARAALEERVRQAEQKAQKSKQKESSRGNVIVMTPFGPVAVGSVVMTPCGPAVVGPRGELFRL